MGRGSWDRIIKNLKYFQIVFLTKCSMVDTSSINNTSRRRWGGVRLMTEWTETSCQGQLWRHSYNKKDKAEMILCNWENKWKCDRSRNEIISRGLKHTLSSKSLCWLLKFPFDLVWWLFLLKMWSSHMMLRPLFFSKLPDLRSVDLASLWKQMMTLTSGNSFARAAFTSKS